MSPAYSLDRSRFAELAGPQVTALVAACHAVLADGAVAPADLTSVILAGAGARLPMVAGAVAEALGHEPRRTPEPEFAAVRGAARWAAGTDRRRIPADPPRWRIEPVAFEVPTGSRMLRRRDGAAGLTAEIRTPDDLVHGLAAPVVPAGPPPPAGSAAGPVLVVAGRRPVAALAADPPPLLHRLGPAIWLFDVAGQVLLGYADGVLRTHDPASGTVRAEVRPGTTDPGRLYVGPAGPVLLTWGADGVTGWDPGTGKPVVRLPATAGALDVLVDEEGWRLAAEIPARGSVGRYRRSSVGVWELRTGARLDQSRGTGFAADSVRDGLGTARTAPDGRLTVAVAAGRVTLAEDGIAVFRTAGDRAAFTADGRHLLIRAGGTVDVRTV